MIIDLKRSIDRRWLFKSGATFILRWSCLSRVCAGHWLFVCGSIFTRYVTVRDRKRNKNTWVPYSEFWRQFKGLEATQSIVRWLFLQICDKGLQGRFFPSWTNGGFCKMRFSKKLMLNIDISSQKCRISEQINVKIWLIPEVAIKILSFF